MASGLHLLISGVSVEIHPGGCTMAPINFKQGETNMADKGKKDKGKREKQKKAQLTLKEKRRLIKEKRQKAPPPAVASNGE